MSGKIFINYRRDDSSASAGRLYDRLAARFPKDQIFIDVDNLDPGVDFVEVIEQSVGSCDVLIAVIGRRWLSSSEAEGSRRLDNPDDFVRIEIATALKRNIRVIPVLVDGASMPRPSDLPDDLKSLLRRNAVEVTHTRFSVDSDRLIAAIERVFEKTAAEHREREEKARLEAERREAEKNARLEAERRQREEQDQLETEQREREEKDRLAVERRETELKERSEAERQQNPIMIRKSRGWLIAGAILSLLVGLIALSSPLFFSVSIVQLLGAFVIAGGVISLFIAIFGKDVAPRGFNALSALIRIGAGVALLSCVRSGLNLLTFIFATYLTVEGIFCIFGALKIRQQDGWIFMLFNGIVTLALGIMVYAHWPSGSVRILGLFLGISLLIHEISQLMLGLAASKTVA
jgi:uncharacterized membrane protein HdeD (DUF308 family)